MGILADLHAILTDTTTHGYERVRFSGPCWLLGGHLIELEPGTTLSCIDGVPFGAGASWLEPEDRPQMRRDLERLHATFGRASKAELVAFLAELGRRVELDRRTSKRDLICRATNAMVARWWPAIAV